MDVLRPPIVRIGTRCYRKTDIQEAAAYVEEDFDHRQTGTGEVDLYDDEETCEADLNIEETESGFRLRLDIPSIYFKFIIGKKGETKRRLENETGTQIRIPKQGVEGEVVISGHERKGVLSANTRIDVLVESARQRQPFTHFLSFPVITKGVKKKFDEFKEDVLRFCEGDKGLDETIFQNPSKLHLTIGTLVLANDSEIDKAVHLLEQCKREFTDSSLLARPLNGHFKGLEYMNDDPGEVDVLYAKVQLDDGTDRLQQVADTLVERFCAARLMQRDYDRVKLHVTVMNTLMRQDPSGASVPRRGQKQRESFNATNVLKNFGEFDFGVHPINEVQLSQRYSTGANGYYACAGRITL